MLSFLQRSLVRPLVMIGGLYCCAVPSSLQGSQFTVDNLFLAATIAQGDDVFSDGTTLLQNPLVDHFAVGLDASTSMMDVNIAWDEDIPAGRFLVQPVLLGQGSAIQQLAADSAARFFITPAAPLTIRVRGEYTVNLPAGGLFSRFEFFVIGEADQSLPVYESFTFSTSGSALSQSRSLDIQFELSPTQTWSLHATMNLLAPAGAGAGMANGLFDIQIIPTPSSLALLLLGSPLLLRRTR